MSSRPALAVSLYVAGRRCVVVGDGALAAERAERLRAADAEVIMVSPAAWRPELADGAQLVFALDAATAAAVTRDARARGALAYALDLPALSDFAMPALARRGPLSLAIATDGAAPALARRLREELERLLTTAGAELDALLEELTRARATLPAGERKDRLYALARRLRLAGRIEIDRD